MQGCWDWVLCTEINNPIPCLGATDCIWEQPVLVVQISVSYRYLTYTKMCYACTIWNELSFLIAARCRQVGNCKAIRIQRNIKLALC